MVLAAILERNRALMVEKYRSNRRLWPDGIDTAGDRWYGDGSSWTAERIAAAKDAGVFEGRVVVPKAVPKLEGAEPWLKEGVSRRTWFRRRKDG